MKRFPLVLVTCSLFILPACNEQNHKEKTPAAANEKYSSIEGSWETVSFDINGRQTQPKRIPQQFKMFHDGFFCLVMYDDSGNFSLAGAGPYELTGDLYKETFTYSSDTNYINSKNWQKWEMKGDTLIFYGFEKAEMPDGQDVTKQWNENGKFIEKRVQAKR